MKKKISLSIISLFFLFQSICAVSILCNDCDVKDCTCNTECNSGFMTIYAEKCQGIPKYELSIVGGVVKWQPPMKGTYYSQLICDNGDNSGCEQITVPTKISEQIPSESFFPYLLAFAFVLVLAFLVYNYTNR